MTALEAPADVIDREAFNVGGDEHNFTIGDLAYVVRDALPQLDVNVTSVPDDADKRSYRVSFKKIREKLGYHPKADMRDSVIEIARAIQAGRLGDCSDTVFHTVKHMKALAMVTTVARLSNMPRTDSLETISKSFSFDASSARNFRKAETA